MVRTKKVAHEAQPSVPDVPSAFWHFCDLLLNGPMGTWNLFVSMMKNIKWRCQWWRHLCVFGDVMRLSGDAIRWRLLWRHLYVCPPIDRRNQSKWLFIWLFTVCMNSSFVPSPLVSFTSFTSIIANFDDFDFDLTLTFFFFFGKLQLNNAL